MMAKQVFRLNFDESFRMISVEIKKSKLDTIIYLIMRDKHGTIIS